MCTSGADGTPRGAHAVVGYRLGVPLGVVSIRGTSAYGGMCKFRQSNRPGLDLDPASPLVAQRAVPRRYWEFRRADGSPLSGPVAV